MNKTVCLRVPMSVAAAILIALLLIVAITSAVTSQGDKKDLTKATFYGVSTCMKCHTEKTPQYPDDFVLLNEYTTWRTKDKHALAFSVLEGPRGQQMARLLGIEVTKDAKCLNCHA